MRNRATQWGMVGRVARAVATGVAIALLPLPACADNSLPPPQYDIGGDTENEVIAIAYAMDIPVVTFRVQFEQAQDECNRLWMERWGRPYPAANDGTTLLGCMVKARWPSTNATVVYTYDYPDISAARLLRHEIGHALGWPSSHRRD